jgi:hypothetical protein
LLQKKVLDQLKKPINISEEESNENTQQKYLLSSDFNVVNLDEAIKIVDDVNKLNRKEIVIDMKHGK